MLRPLIGPLLGIALLGAGIDVQAASLRRPPLEETPEAESDSLVAGRDSSAAAADSLIPPPPRYRALAPSFATSPTGALARGAFDVAPNGTLREVLAQPLGLSRAAGGSYHLPDALDWGDLPGREPLTLTSDGVPLSKPNQSEMPPDLISPVWIGSAVLAPVDPVDAPNLATGGDRLAVTLERPDSAAAISGTRLTSGANASHTEEFYLLRPAGRSLLRLFYGDHKTIGRLLYLDELGENLRLDWERDLSVGRWSVGWHRSQARQKLIDERRWIFERTGFDAGIDRRIGHWELSSRGALDWGHLAWEGDAHQAKRKDAVAQALIRLTGPPLLSGASDSTGQASGLLPVLSLQIDRDHLRFYAPGSLSLDESSIGLGFAAGLRGGTKTWRLRVSAGRAEPVGGRAGLTGLAELERAGEWVRSRVSLRQGVRPRVLPRYGNHLSTQVNQPFLSPVLDRDAPLERVRTAEATLARGGGARQLELRLRGVEIAHAVSAEGGLLSRFTPDGFAFLPESALDRTIRVASVHLRARSELGRGLSLDARVAARRSDPGWRDQFWMTPFESQVRLALGRAFFAERLRLRGYVEAGWVGQRATPNGILDPRDRYDAGIEGEIADFRVDFQFVNLEGDLTEASGYDGGWMVLPLGSIRMGLVWRFVD